MEHVKVRGDAMGVVPVRRDNTIHPPHYFRPPTSLVPPTGLFRVDYDSVTTDEALGRLEGGLLYVTFMRSGASVGGCVFQGRGVHPALLSGSPDYARFELHLPGGTASVGEAAVVEGVVAPLHLSIPESGGVEDPLAGTGFDMMEVFYGPDEVAAAADHRTDGRGVRFF